MTMRIVSAVPTALLALALAGCVNPPPSTLTPTMTPETSSPLVRAVAFPAKGGATLHGTWFAVGADASTTVVLSNVCDNDPAAWETFAAQLARPSIAVLTYAYRYPVGGAGFTSSYADDAVRDLNGAVAYARQR